MTGKQVWCPSKSRAPDQAQEMEQERGRGSFKQHAVSKPHVAAPRRRTTSEKRVIADEDRVQPTDSGYSTVERGRSSSILDYSCPNSLGYQTHPPEFSGWREREELLPPSPRRPVQAPGAGVQRSSTRQETRERGRGRHYEFQHCLEAHAHMDHYRTHYCYTTLSTAPGTGGRAPELVQQNKEALLTLEVKSLCRGDPFLRELASRLGVGESIREPQLLTSNRRTPPSIVKRHKTKTDLVIDLTPKSRSDEGEDDAGSPLPAWAVDNTKTGRHTSLELPRIPEVTPIKDKTSSSISVTKYLRVSSQGGEGSESSHTLPPVTTSHTLLSSASSQDLLTTEVTECTDYAPNLTDQPLPLLPVDQRPVHTLDKAVKERLITQTAQSLGLTSREWAAPPTNRQINKYLGYLSRPLTRQAEHKGRSSGEDRPSTRQAKGNRPSTRQDGEKRPSTRQNRESRPSTRQAGENRPATKQVRKRATGQEGKETRPSTRLQQHKTTPTREGVSTRQKHRQTDMKPRPLSTLRQKDKLDRLKSIYKSQHSHSPPHTRPPTRSHTRPPTRTHSHPSTHMWLPTRAKTKLNEFPQLDILEGSSYWNELPNKQRSQIMNIADKGKVKGSTEQGFSPVGLALELSQHIPQGNRQLLASALKHTQTRRTVHVNEELRPGASPLEIARRLSQLKGKFDDVLNTHNEEIFTEN